MFDQTNKSRIRPRLSTPQMKQNVNIFVNE